MPMNFLLIVFQRECKQTLNLRLLLEEKLSAKQTDEVIMVSPSIEFGLMSKI